MMHQPISAVDKDEIMARRRQHDMTLTLDLDVIVSRLDIKAPERPGANEFLDLR